MPLIKFIVSFIILVLLFWVSRFGFGALPPVANLINPFTGFWQNAEQDLPENLKNLQLKGILKPVSVLFDERLVPHIFAENDIDIYYAQGYVTAALRLWQMDMQTRAAAGRLSEVAGEKALNKDREARRLGLVLGAEKSLVAMLADKETEGILKAYTKGINDYIEQLSIAELPLEYKLLNFKPEPWSPLKTALLLSYMGNMLTGSDYDIENSNARKMVGDSLFNQIFANFPDTLLEPIIPIGTIFSKNLTDSSRAFLYPHDVKGKQFDRSPDDVGSNNWAVSGAKSTLKSPILCDDMHLSLNLPSIWFEVQLHTPNMNVYGASLPGAPGVIVGFNDSIAWGLTNASMDVKDWYAIEYKNKQKTHYLLDSVWIPTTYRAEVIKIKSQKDFIDTVYYTHWGPVAFDEQYNKGNETVNLALKWTLHLPSNELKTFAGLNKAKNYEEYKSAIQYFQNPGQNFAFVSASGDIALHQQGLFVNRKIEQGRFIQDGTTRQNDWRGYIPTSDNPHTLNPARNYVSSANQHPTDQTYPYYYTGIYESFRNRRINNRLNEMQQVSIADMQKLQNDNYSLYASEALPILLNQIDNNQLNDAEKELIALLNRWDFYYEADVEEPVFFELWWDEFRKLLWDEFYTADRIVQMPNFAQTIRFIQKNKSGEMFDLKTTSQTEDLKSLSVLSFQKAHLAWDGLKKEQKKWSGYKNTTIKHLSTLPAFSVTGIENGGNSGIINATRHNYGPSWRMIVAPGVKGEAYGVYPGGQSGNPGSKFYANFINQWAGGKYYKLHLFHSKNETEHVILAKQFKP